MPPTASASASKSAVLPANATALNFAPEKPSVKKKVIYEGGTVTSTGEVYSGVPQGDDAAAQRATTELVQEATENLRKLDELSHAGKLNAEQLATKAQSHTFLNQALEAVRDGDLPRTRTLAQKAKLLSDSLLPH